MSAIDDLLIELRFAETRLETALEITKEADSGLPAELMVDVDFALDEVTGLIISIEALRRGGR